MKKRAGNLLNKVLRITFSPFFLSLFSLRCLFFQQRPLSSLPARFTLGWYELVRLSCLDDTSQKVLVGIAVSLAAIVLGFTSAYGLRHADSAGKTYTAGMMSPLPCPGCCWGWAVNLFSRLGMPKSLFTVWISHLVFAHRSLWSLSMPGLIRFQSLEEATSDLGAGHCKHW